MSHMRNQIRKPHLRSTFVFFLFLSQISFSNYKTRKNFFQQTALLNYGLFSNLRETGVFP
jgi:hypothetical protein